MFVGRFLFISGSTKSNTRGYLMNNLHSNRRAVDVVVVGVKILDDEGVEVAQGNRLHLPVLMHARNHVRSYVFYPLRSETD